MQHRIAEGVETHEPGAKRGHRAHVRRRECLEIREVVTPASIDPAIDPAVNTPIQPTACPTAAGIDDSREEVGHKTAFAPWGEGRRRIVCAPRHDHGANQHGSPREASHPENLGRPLATVNRTPTMVADEASIGGGAARVTD